MALTKLAKRTVFLVSLAGTLLCLGVSVCSAQTLSFAPAGDFPAGSISIGMAVGDFNGDGIPDVAVANVGSNNVSILLGTGTGSFGAATNFAVGSTPR